MSVVFAGEDSEEDSEGVGQEEMEILTQLNNDDNKLVGKDQDVSNEKNGENVKSALDILHPLDVMNKTFLDNVMPKLDIADQKLKELSVNQIELSKEMEMQEQKLHYAPALHKTHKIMRQVPQYQEKIDTLRKDMKAITALVEKMKSQSLALQLRVQEAVLKHQEKKTNNNQ